MAYTFRKLKMRDAYNFSKWGMHEDIRFYQYNFPFEERADYLYWYLVKQHIITRKVYALFNSDDDPVGFITLKNIQWLRRTAELGIGIDPNHLSEGLGRTLITAFLDYVFKVYPIRTMTLRVATFNTRAQRCYLSCGFEKVAEKKEPFEEQSFRYEIMEHYEDQFEMIDDVLYTSFYVMETDREAFKKRRSGSS